MKYWTHYNGGRPFHVHVHSNAERTYVEVFRDKNCVFAQFVTKVFVGQSLSSDNVSYDSYFDGNSILLHIEKDEYVFIGDSIYSFESYSKIYDFNSQVGPNDVPYPYAIDISNNTYLFAFNVVLHGVYDDPNEQYLKSDLITPDTSRVKQINDKWVQDPILPLCNFENVTKFYIGNQMYTLRYSPHASTEYDRITRPNFNNQKQQVSQDDDILELSIVQNNINKTLSKKEYISFMERFAAFSLFKPFKSAKIIEEQQVACCYR